MDPLTLNKLRSVSSRALLVGGTSTIIAAQHGARGQRFLTVVQRIVEAFEKLALFINRLEKGQSGAFLEIEKLSKQLKSLVVNTRLEGLGIAGGKASELAEAIWLVDELVAALKVERRGNSVSEDVSVLPID